MKKTKTRGRGKREESIATARSHVHLDGALLVCERDVPASSLRLSIDGLLSRMGGRRVSIAVASLDPLAAEVAGGGGPDPLVELLDCSHPPDQHQRCVAIESGSTFVRCSDCGAVCYRMGDVAFTGDGVVFQNEREPTLEEWRCYRDGGYPWHVGSKRNPHATESGDADWAAPMSFRYDVDPEREVTGFTWCSLCGRRADRGVVAQSVNDGEGRGSSGFFCATCVRAMAEVVERVDREVS